MLTVWYKRQGYSGWRIPLAYIHWLEDFPYWSEFLLVVTTVALLGVLGVSAKADMAADVKKHVDNIARPYMHTQKELRAIALQGAATMEKRKACTRYPRQIVVGLTWNALVAKCDFPSEQNNLVTSAGTLRLAVYNIFDGFPLYVYLINDVVIAVESAWPSN